jgi:predicted HTH transcriptional regulator
LNDEQQKVLDHVKRHGAITNTTCRELLNIGDHQAYYLLRKLSETGLLQAEGKGRWRKHVLR